MSLSGSDQAAKPADHRSELLQRLSALGARCGWHLPQAAEAALRKVKFRITHPGGWKAAKLEKKSQADEVCNMYRTWHDAKAAMQASMKARQAEGRNFPTLQQAQKAILQEEAELAEAVTIAEPHERKMATMDEAGDLLYCHVLAEYLEGAAERESREQSHEVKPVPRDEAEAALERQRQGTTHEYDEVTLSHIKSRGIETPSQATTGLDQEKNAYNTLQLDIRQAARKSEPTKPRERPEPAMAPRDAVLQAAWVVLTEDLYFSNRDSVFNQVYSEWLTEQDECKARIADATEDADQEATDELVEVHDQQTQRPAVAADQDEYAQATQEMYDMYSVEDINEHWLVEDREARRRQEARQAWPAMMQRARAKRVLQNKNMVQNDTQLMHMLAQKREQKRQQEQQQTAQRQKNAARQTRAARAREQQKRESEKKEAEAMRSAQKATLAQGKKDMLKERWLLLQQKTVPGEVASKRLSGEVLALAEQTARQILGSTMVQTVQAKMPNIKARNWHEARAEIAKREAHAQGVLNENIGDGRKSEHHRIKEVVESIEEGNHAKLREELATAVCAAVSNRTRSIGAMNAEEERRRPMDVWDETNYHAVKVRIKIKGAARGEEIIEVIADSGAGMSLCSETKLSEDTKSRIMPRMARLMQSASTHRIHSKGGAILEFQLGDEPHMFNHKWQVIEGSGTPEILGNDFWVLHKAKFDFDTRKIYLQVEGRQMEVPFTVGDEKSDERIMTVCSVQDVMVPPRSAYTIRGLPHSSASQVAKLSAGHTWWVGPREDREQEELMRQAKQCYESVEETAARHAQARKLRQTGKRESRAQQTHRHTRRTDPTKWGAGGLQVSQEEMEKQQLQEEIELMIGSGTAEGIVRPAWDDNSAVLPVHGVNASDEPLIIRKGQQIGVACRLSADTVANVREGTGPYQATEGGTKVSGMSLETEHAAGDWRKGKSWKQVIAATRKGQLQIQFEKWRNKNEEFIKIGEEEGKPGAVEEEIKELYLRLIFAYREVIAENPKKPGIIPGVKHTIILNTPKENVTPWKENVRRSSPAEEVAKEAEVEMLVQNDIVEESNSPFSNNIVVVKKKDGSLRTCIDFRRLNEITVFDAFPLSRIDESLDMLGKAKYISTLDNSSAFWSCALDEAAKEMTAFGTRSHGQLQFKRMPFGLKNATATYARALMHVLRGLVWKCCVIYCDDSVIYGNTFDGHMEALHSVMKRYSIHNVNVKLSKCHFACHETEFVGHTVEVGAGVRVDMKKIKALLERGRPQDVQTLKSWIGACSYYKRFIKDFAHLIMPMRKIEHVFKTKTMDIQPLWGPDQERSFVALKAAMVTAPVLAFPDFEKPFCVASDCSDVAKGAVLFQIIDGVERPIAYYSKALNEHERKYGISDKEGCAATSAIRHWRAYLHGSHTILITDHSSLLSLTGGKELRNMRQQRYAMDLSEHSLTIIHRAGALLHLPDALSRMGYSTQLGESAVSAVRDVPMERCTLEYMKERLAPTQNGDVLRAKVKAAGQHIAGGVAGLATRLEQQEAVFTPVPESDEEESRTVEMYDVVMAAAIQSPKTRSSKGNSKKGSTDMQDRTFAFRQDNPKRKGSASAARYDKYKAANTYEEFLELGGTPADFKHDAGKGFAVEVKVDSDSDYSDNEASDHSDSEANKVEAQANEDNDSELAQTEEENQEEEIDEESRQLAERHEKQKTDEMKLALSRMKLNVETLIETQDRHPRMKQLRQYLKEGALPEDRLERIWVLQTAPMHEVNQAGMLCRVKERGNKGSLGLEMQVLVPETLRGEVVARIHEEAGHASTLKTYQRVRERFYWPGMFTDVAKYVTYCTQCQLDSVPRKKALITKHIEAAAPGETWVIDLLHYPTAKGFRYVLVAIDAYSRWGEVKALPDKYAATVAEALFESVVTNTAGQPKLLVSDQGSEFKGDLAAAVALLKIQQKYTAAYRSEGHGLAERFNRTISDTMKSMVSQNDPEWHKALKWAKLAYNASIHASLSHEGEGISPAEVHLGRRLNFNLEAELPSQAAANGTRTPSQYVKELQIHVEAVKAWVQQCRLKYNSRMRKYANKRGRADRQFNVGDTVRLQDVARKGVGRKLLRVYDGPYQVLEKTDDNEYSIQKLGEGKKIKFRVHADRLAKFNDLMEMDTRTKAQQEQAPENTEDYEVEFILDDTGSRAAGTKRYLVRFEGWGPEYDEWIRLEELQCADKVQQYELKQVGVYNIADYKWTGEAGTAIFAVHTGGKDVSLQIDLNGKETPAELMDKICRQANIRREDIVLAWASPPCETYSRANWSNASRGNHYRERPGKEGTVSEEKKEKAKMHDRLAQRVKEVLKMIKHYVMENPQGGLEHMWFMADWEDKKRIVNLCAYMWPFRKTTNLWTNLGKMWQQQGTTGNGRCNEACGQGAIDPITKRFKHFMALAVDPERGPRGPGAARMTCGIPDKLITEILKGMAENVDLGGKVVLDLCSGFQSIREAVLQAGASYVGVDIAGRRTVEATPARRAAVVLIADQHVLAVKHRLQDGGHVVTLPGGKREQQDDSLHAAGVRELLEEVGLSESVWRELIVKGPDVYALHDTTYYVYHLSRVVPKATMLRAFRARTPSEAQKITAWQWANIRDIDSAVWRNEDVEWIKKYLEREERGMLSSTTLVNVTS